MDGLDLRFWFQVAQSVATAAVAFWVWIDRRQTATQADHAALNVRLTALEERVKHMPDTESVTELMADVRGMKAELAGVRAALEPVSRSLDRINDYLLNKKG